MLPDQGNSGLFSHLSGGQQYCCTHIPALLHLDQSEAAHRVYYVSGSKVQCLGSEHADHCHLQIRHPNGLLLQENHICLVSMAPA